MSMIKEGSIVVVRDWTDQKKEVKVDNRVNNTGRPVNKKSARQTLDPGRD